MLGGGGGQIPGWNEALIDVEDWLRIDSHLLSRDNYFTSFIFQ